MSNHIHEQPTSRYKLANRKQTKTYGLEGLYTPARQGSSFHSQPCPSKRPTATR